MALPDFQALEERLVTEFSSSLTAVLSKLTPEDPLACCVLEGVPFHGIYTLHLDVRSNQWALLRGEQAQRLARRAWTRATSPDAWLESAELAAIDGLSPFSSEVADYALCAVHEVRVEVRDFTRSPEYATMNAIADADGQDGWLEGHARPMLFRVCDRLVEAGLFSAVPHLVPTVVGFTLGEARATVCRLLLD